MNRLRTRLGALIAVAAIFLSLMPPAVALPCASARAAIPEDSCLCCESTAESCDLSCTLAAPLTLLPSSAPAAATVDPLRWATGFPVDLIGVSPEPADPPPRA
ncbi:MAG: hypothetical protein SFV21_04480 [Rhodospirillaceae bacterium]|nr:hypothetical protein [Rhodospirillaceae bacterium]